MTRTLATAGLALAAVALLAGEVSAQDATMRGGRRDGQTAAQGQAGQGQGRQGQGAGQGAGRTGAAQAGTRGSNQTVTTQQPAAAATTTTTTLVQPNRPVAAAPSRPQFSDRWFSTRTPGIDAREAHQEHAIERGRRNGSLTGGEYAQLRAEQDRIDDLEQRAKADGRVTHDERIQIRRAQADAERHIQQETHDREGRSPRRHWGWSRGWW